MPRYPALLQINARAWLSERSAALERPATLDDVPDEALERIARQGFDWVWLLGVWQTGEAGRRVSLETPEWQPEYQELLGEFTADDVAGSPFAIRDYVVNRDFGGPEALAALRERLAAHGVKLMLDFVPNHTAPDHRWVSEHPEYYVHGAEQDLAREPHNYRRVGDAFLALGRDPYFPGWPDTLQLNYRHRGLREAMLAVLRAIAAQCDGVRCDMAMLVLPDVFLRTWGERSRPADGSPPADEPFWPYATQGVRRHWPKFTFMAEAYWDLEWTLQQQGFDYTYDKRLYDRLHGRDAKAVRDHLHADSDYQSHSVRFLENHDEPRAASAFESSVHKAAAVIGLLAPGLRFVHDGQATGRRFRASNHLRRRAVEPVDRELETFYGRLFEAMRRPEVRDGDWQLLEPRPAASGNGSSAQFVAYGWHKDGRRLLVAVNYGPQRAQCFLPVPYSDLAGTEVTLRDRMNPTISYRRNGDELLRPGLYLDMPPWRHHVFDLVS
jgi:glycosidase